MGDIIQEKMLIKEIRNVIRRCQFRMTFPRFRDLEFSFINPTKKEIQEFLIQYLTSQSNIKDQVTQKPNPKRGKDTAVLAKFLTVIGKEYSKRADISLSGASNFKDSLKVLPEPERLCQNKI